MLRRPVACTLLLCYLAACTSWHVQEGVSPSQFITTAHPRVVRLTRANGSHVSLADPRVVAGDSLTGIHNTVLYRVAVSDFTELATPGFSPAKTIGVLVGLGVLVVGIAAIACVSGSGCAKQ